MKKAQALRLLLLCVSPSPWAASQAPEAAGIVQVGSAHRDDIRRTVARHRDAQREEGRRSARAAGRRLTASELLELRTQVRQQSQAQAEADVGAPRALPPEAKPATPILPTSVRSLTMPRSQRQP